MKTPQNVLNATYTNRANSRFNLGAQAAGSVWRALKMLFTLPGRRLFVLTPSQSMAALRAENTKLAAINTELMQLAHTDHLTGLPNRRAFLQAGQLELARIQRNGQSACLVLGDIDHFKAFNDCCGHAAGDRILQIVAQSLRTSLRAADTVARWGGEELIMLLPETELLGAQRAAEKCRLAVQAYPLSCREHPTGVTMTFATSACTRFTIEGEVPPLNHRPYQPVRSKSGLNL